MDCEKFDRIVLDLLYGELDELTDAAARRHIEHCSRCKSVSSGLRATREVGALALVEPPPSLELGILEAERRVNAKLPLAKKFGRAVSILAVYAMRPQLAMAALLLLMIGASLFFLRSRPGARDSILVTERGVPENEAEHVALVPAPLRAAAEPSAAPLASAPSKPAPAATLKGEAVALREREAAADKPIGGVGLGAVAAPAKDEAKPSADGDALSGADPVVDSMEAAKSAFQGGRYVEAQRRFEEIAARGGSDAPAAALEAVEALRRQRGCPAAAPRYEEVHARYPDSASGNEAAWQAGDCYRALGELGQARLNLEPLLQIPEYRSRAQAALQELSAREEQVASAAKKAKAAAAAPAAPPPSDAKAARAKAGAAQSP
jgi:hypothetical protein